MAVDQQPSGGLPANDWLVYHRRLFRKPNRLVEVGLPEKYRRLEQNVEGVVLLVVLPVKLVYHPWKAP